MEAAAQVALWSNPPDTGDTTQALLKTFAWVEPPEEDTSCLVSTKPPHRNREQQRGSQAHENNQAAIKAAPGMLWLHCCSCCLP